MRALLEVLVFLIAGGVGAAGALRAVSCHLRSRRCTAQTQGTVADVAERRTLLSWPAETYYYPIFSYDADGQTQIAASGYPAQHQGEIQPGKVFSIRYDPRRPAYFFAEGWDEGGLRMGLAQCAIGAVLLVLTLYLT